MISRTLPAAIAGMLLIAPLAATAEAAPRMARPSSDFNGDGYQDLAIGAPKGIVGGKQGAGYASVVYGSKTGLNPKKRQLITQDTTGVPGASRAHGRFGTSVATGDLNADGYADLAVGAPQDAPINEYSYHGSITVLFGSKTGLKKASRVTGKAYRLGTALGMADVNGDGRLELIGTEVDGFYGEVRLFAVPRKGVVLRSLPHRGHRDGTDFVATGDLNGDKYGDVVTTRALAGGGGSVAGVYLGSASGLRLTSQVQVGAVVAAIGDVNGDGRDDLVGGQPYGFDPSGNIRIWYGTRTGINADAGVILSQRTPGVPGDPVDYDWFGSAVAVRDVNGDGFADVAVGVQNKKVGGRDDAGSVVLLKGARSGLGTKGAQVFSQNTAGVPDTAEVHDQFGWWVTLADFNKDRKADLVVSAPGENARDYGRYKSGDGAVTVLRGTRTGLTTGGAVGFGPRSVGANPANAAFGWMTAP